MDAPFPFKKMNGCPSSLEKVEEKSNYFLKGERGINSKISKNFKDVINFKNFQNFKRLKLVKFLKSLKFLPSPF